MTDEQILASLSASCNGHKVIKYDSENHKYDWATDGHPILWKELMRSGEIIAGVDMGLGQDLLFDGKEWHKARYGVFTGTLAFVTDYYNFPKGALFKRVTPDESNQTT